MLLYSYVDISDFVLLILDETFTMLENFAAMLESIIIFDANDFGVGSFVVSLFDFCIALVVISIVIGAFVHVNKADNFYSNRKD